LFTEDELLPISALQHLEYCPRRCALIHVEGQWAENAMTAEGRVLHQRAHEAASETNQGIRIARRLRLASRSLGLFGVADVVEFHPTEDDDGAALECQPGRWRAYPVEYKRGQRKPEVSYHVQLCAQAMCLEEMLDTRISCGALYHGQTRRRQPVEFDDALRHRVLLRTAELHELLDSKRSPPPAPGPKCRFCSLAGTCLPKLLSSQSAREYVSRSIASILRQRE
jgi:CRISPR-associated exonuclease Cas4